MAFVNSQLQSLFIRAVLFPALAWSAAALSWAQEIQGEARTAADIKTANANVNSGASAFSQRPWLSISGASYHLERAQEFNQKNPGVGLEWPVTAPWVYDTRIALGTFKNSESARSNYAGAFIFPWSNESGRFKAGALLGVINGYQGANNGGFFLLAVPTLAYEADVVGANLFIIPPVSTIPTTLAVQLKFRF